MKRDARTIISRVLGRTALITPVLAGIPINIATGVAVPDLDCIADLRSFAAGDDERHDAELLTRRSEVASAYGYNAPGADKKPFLLVDGVAVIPIHGTLINRFSGSWGFVTGYNFIRSQLMYALADPDVTAVIFDVHSYGGEVSGCFELAEYIFASRDEKPMLAVVDSACCSAAYALASSCNKVMTTPSSWVGSVGVVAMHVDFSAALAEVGIKVTFIFAGDHKIDGNPYQALTDDVKADMQAEVNKIYGQFVTLVARNRDLTADAVRGTQAKIYSADDALAAKLIDAVYSPPQALAAFLATLEDDDQEELDDQDPSETEDEPTMAMTPEEKRAAFAEERARVKAITTSPEAKGRESLAAHFAHETDMTPDAAVAALKAAPLAAVAAPVVVNGGTTAVAGGTVELTSAERDALRRYMDAEGGAGIGPGAHEAGGNGGPDPTAETPKTRAQRILAAQAKVTGIKPKAA